MRVATLYKVISIALALCSSGCTVAVMDAISNSGGPFTPTPTDYQVTVCSDLGETILYVKSIEGLIVTDITPPSSTIANNQVVIQNNYFSDSSLTASLAPGVSVKKDSTINDAYRTTLKWKQGDEDIDMDIALPCVLDSFDDASSCVTLTNGKIEKSSVTYNQKGGLSVVLDINYATPKGGTARIAGKLLYEAKNGKVDLKEINCSVRCITTKAGYRENLLENALAEEDHNDAAQRDCSYTCDNGTIGLVPTTCSTPTCEDEASYLLTSASGVSKGISCTVINNDFSSFPPLTVLLSS